MSAYPVGLVGEATSQSIIATCRAGDRVLILHEVGNPHDERALVVTTRQGYRMGYVSRDSWLREAVFDQRKGCDAVIQSIEGRPGGPLGVVLTVQLTDQPVDQVLYQGPKDNRRRNNLIVLACVGAFIVLLAIGLLQDQRRPTRSTDTAAPSAPRTKAERQAAYRENVEWTDRGCRELPATTERLAGRRMTPGERRRAVRDCLQEAEAGRRELENQGLIERP